MKKIIYTLIPVICFSCLSFGQVSIKDSVIKISLVTLSYSYQFPGGNIAKNFLSNNAIGAGYFFKTRKNWLFGVDGYFMFRDTIKENGVLKYISTTDGAVIDGNGTYADINLFERGFNLSLKAGKLFPFFGPNKNSGIVFFCGPGFLQYKIRIENPGNAAYQVKGDYKKGYDRLTNGFSLSEFLGYMYLGNTRLLCFFGGFDFTQAWTKNRRYNFDLMGYDNTKNFDLLSGFRVGWILPLYKQSPNKYYYN